MYAYLDFGKPPSNGMKKRSGSLLLTGMTESEYRSKRTFAIRFFGIFMIAVSAFLLMIGPYTAIREKNCATAYVMGEVVAVEGTDIKIYYTLPGETEGWLVTKHGEGWSKGDEVRVFYNPDNLEEKYIEGFEENPWLYVALSICGLALGAAALWVSMASRNSDTVNEVIDMFDRG